MDSSQNPQQTGNRAVLGDLIVIAGAICYGCSNVLQEALICRHGIFDFLGLASGLVAAILTASYCFGLEWSQLSGPLGVASWSADQWGCFLGYAAAMLALYVVMPAVLQRTSAVLVNLSLLTADVYALVMGVLIFGLQFHYLYLVSFAVILAGVALFSVQPTVDPLGRQMAPVINNVPDAPVNYPSQRCLKPTLPADRSNENHDATGSWCSLTYF
ncbi:unnamed protein product [Protopolystoma xenopodis]|uniref:EamA domain-containing protein n=1 Tax=Protopolystoma xenopodis TaxID=117903 RepID=A0A448XCL4_9PLAT|nr:unnamed protein product [Protopolystoma xenopodis]